MREILFRGKRVDNGEWVFGSYIEHEHAIVYPTDISPDGATLFCEGAEIIESTVGQYTGLTDKNGKKIFEGDIVVKNGGVPLLVCFEDFMWQMVYINNEYKHRLENEDNKKWEVIGNIYDNPELLENSKENKQ